MYISLHKYTSHYIAIDIHTDICALICIHTYQYIIAHIILQGNGLALGHPNISLIGFRRLYILILFQGLQRQTKDIALNPKP